MNVYIPITYIILNVYGIHRSNTNIKNKISFNNTVVSCTKKGSIKRRYVY